MRKTYGLEDPVWLQLLKYIWALMRFDFGFSYRQNMPVIQAIWIHLPATLLLMVSSIALALAVGVAAGVVASMKVRTFWDSLVSVAAMFFFAAPSFWLGIMLIVLFAVKLGWLPVGGMMTIGGAGGVGGIFDILHHLILPTLALGLFYAAIYTRVMRSSMLEVAQLDFVRTARAKGLSRNKVTIAHVLRNALLPVVTILGVQMGTVLAGSVVIESVFSWPGIGSLLFDSVQLAQLPRRARHHGAGLAGRDRRQHRRRPRLHVARPAHRDPLMARFEFSFGRRFARNRGALDRRPV